jgi:hypothetical protein
MDMKKKEIGGWFIWILFLFVVAGVILTSTGYIGKFTGTVVERKVFEQSYQRSESLKSEIAMNQAVIEEIESKLLNPNLDENTRFNLNAQLGAAKLRISTARRKQ